MLRLTALLLSLTLLFSAPGVLAQSEDVIRFEPTPELSVYRSKHYRIHTALSRTETQPYGRHMDALHDQYLKRFRGLGEQQIEPMPLYLFSTEQQYNRFLQEHDIDASHSGGMFFITHKIEGLATWVQRDSRRKTFEVLQHEGFHQFAWHVFGPRLPVWLNEGLAQYFEDALLIDGQMTLGLARSAKIMKVQNELKSGRPWSAKRMLAITTEQWAETLRRDPSHASLIYAQAWSLTYFLIHGDNGVHKSKLLDYLERISDGDRPQDAEFMAFGQGGIASLNRAWRKFALNQQPDALSRASERLSFLGTGLRVLAEQGESVPSDLNALREMLQERGFRLRQSEMGVTQDFSADHADLYRYTRDAYGQRDFVMLRPDRAGLLPRITAPGLKPEPTLIWYRDAKGKLVQEIEYR